MSKSAELAKSWLRQAVLDVKAARSNAKEGSYEWACFASQQAAEKFLKAYLFSQGQRVLESHSLRRLTKEASDHHDGFSELIDAAKALDRYYFSARYPDALSGDVPGDYFSQKDADAAVQYALEFKVLVEKLL